MSKKHHSKKDNLDVVEASDELNEVEEATEEAVENIDLDKGEVAVIKEPLTLTLSSAISSDIKMEKATGVIYPASKAEVKEPFYALDEIEKNILHATKIGNHHLASELHKVNAILSDLNHTFAHLSGEAKLVVSVILKNGKILKC